MKVHKDPKDQTFDEGMNYTLPQREKEQRTKKDLSTKDKEEEEKNLLRRWVLLGKVGASVGA